MVWVMAGETHFGSKRRGREAKRTRRRRPLKATAESLEAAARAYLERYAAPAAHLSRVLLVKVERSARFHGTDREAGAAAPAPCAGAGPRAGRSGASWRSRAWRRTWWSAPWTAWTGI
jgi:hypothetical protein